MGVVPFSQPSPFSKSPIYGWPHLASRTHSLCRSCCVWYPYSASHSHSLSHTCCLCYPNSARCTHSLRSHNHSLFHIFWYNKSMPSMYRNPLLPKQIQQKYVVYIKIQFMILYIWPQHMPHSIVSWHQVLGITSKAVSEEAKFNYSNITQHTHAHTQTHTHIYIYISNEESTSISKIARS